jgi:hypothetical protein
MHPFFLPSIQPSIRLAVHPSLHLSIHLSIHQIVRPPINNSIFDYDFLLCVYTWSSLIGMYFCQIEPMFSYRGRGCHSLRELNWIRINNIKWSLFTPLLLFELWEQ